MKRKVPSYKPSEGKVKKFKFHPPLVRTTPQSTAQPTPSNFVQLANFPFNLLNSTYFRFRVLDVLKQQGPSKPRRKVLRCLELPRSDSKKTPKPPEPTSPSSPVTPTKKDRSSRQFEVHLLDDWFHTPVFPGDAVNVVDDESSIVIPSNPSKEVKIEVTNVNKIYVVLNPDILLSASLIVNSVRCPRRAFLNYMFREYYSGSNFVNESAFFGSLLHKLFQRSIQTNNFTRPFFENVLTTSLMKDLQSLFVYDLSLDDAKKRALEIFPYFLDFQRRFIKQPLGGVVPYFQKNEGRKVVLNNCLAVEESVVSPKWGTKGFIDVSLSAGVGLLNSNNSNIMDVFPVVPMELKSSKIRDSRGRLEHRSQTLLYLIMMSYKYDLRGSKRELKNGLLYYFGTNSVVGVELDDNSKGGLVRTRNTLAGTIFSRRAQRELEKEQKLEKKDDVIQSSPFRKRARSSKKNERILFPSQGTPSSSSLDDEDVMMDFDTVVITLPKPPPVRGDSFQCSHCFQKITCMLYHCSMENGNSMSSGIDIEDFDTIVAKINEPMKERATHVKYIKKWLRMISIEELEVEVRDDARRPWKMTGPLKEKETGKCISCLVVEKKLPELVLPGMHIYKMRKHPHFVGEVNLKRLDFLEGESIEVSSEMGHVGIASGRISEINEKSVCVQLRSPLTLPNTSIDQHGLFRIDKKRFKGFYSISRGNVMSLFSPSASDQVNKLRSLIVDLRPPSYFSESEVSKELQLIHSVSWFRKLNVDQQRAVNTVIMSKDYTLILGMPGTGKTTTIVYIIKALVLLKKKILISSYTHTAIDNILKKLVVEKIDFFRIGDSRKVSPELINYTDYITKSYKTVEEYENFLRSKPIIACTALGVRSNMLFSKLSFDVCIIDEATQMTHPITLGPLTYCKSFILVGDPYQLYPLVVGNKAKSLGMDESLFEYLKNAFDFSVVNLTYQYRMNVQIMQLSNEVVYERKLKCGTKEVARAILELPSFNEFKSSFSGGSSSLLPWVMDIIDPSNKKVLFVNTDRIKRSSESTIGNKILNRLEFKLVHQLVYSLVKCGINLKDGLGVICPFNLQVNQLRNICKAEFAELVDSIHTIDRFQGLDKSCIIISLVRSNEKKEISKIMYDLGRLNVAFTRPKQKLIVVGSWKTHCDKLPIKLFLDIIKRNGGVVNLRDNDHLVCEQMFRNFKMSQTIVQPTQGALFPTQQQQEDDVVDEDIDMVDEEDIDMVDEKEEEEKDVFTPPRKKPKKKKKKKKKKKESDNFVSSFVPNEPEELFRQQLVNISPRKNVGSNRFTHNPFLNVGLQGKSNKKNVNACLFLMGKTKKNKNSNTNPQIKNVQFAALQKRRFQK